MKRATVSMVGAAVAAVLAAGPVAADPPWHARGHGKGEWKDVYWDGPCKVERKWKRNGDYKEERKCKGGGPRTVAPYPVYVDPGPDVFFGRMPNTLAPSAGLPGLACNRDVVGALLGGAAGGLIGNQFGKGDGRTAATIGGAVLGALVGGSLGRSMDGADQACVGQALQYGPVGQPIRWASPAAQYEVTPLRAWQDRGGACREYRTVAVIDGRRQSVNGTACLQSDGRWRVMG
ncbi:glycine zipper 2TM domain-containing protein [Azospirillum halopraeferens]|uniref:glycine zipper 2TM domain-containing protein n=1 Tax=Azospirillum halopraeferens TaxID=34010 RepID=UPI00041B21CB|nr:glycine zipper 2TM domain-containing protein [Azospirillum halopraeferens]